ncbi:TetR/AcrR family transcriptional regulator [Piscinibacter koreensis]|uniref:TetR/AcrR family transcriptional regulator n=1 Tax=Piscinibacter koreensis TaxID=2742824 RepID=A0A7Y6NP72_9BURK|nr:TetR/AcrR family transcriptional regulator [Schlegelella koreensis]NUZ06697.1 TetR/AcrR family transcriptional regulator [Schlegelella koreensis]
MPDSTTPPDRPAAAPRAPKGRQTRATILDAALALAAQIGIEGLSIGVVAEAIGMSKSGVFAHFGSREELQISVVRAYHARFEEDVFTPALRAPRGLPRLTELFERWVRRVSVEADFGCIYISGAVELDDRPGAVRDALVGMVQTWQSALERAILAAVAEGHLRADTDPQQLLFEMHGMVLALHHDARLLRHPGADERARTAYRRLVADHQPRRAARTPASGAELPAPARPRAVRSVAKARVTRRDPA